MNTSKKGLRYLILVGILSPVLYFTASIVGGFSNEGYSHIKHSVSDLLIKGMNNVMLLDVFMLISSLATLISCMAIFIYFRKKSPRGVKLGILLIGFTGISNIMSSYIFRLEESTGGMTFSSIMHIVFVACSALFVIIGAILIAFNINKIFDWKSVKLYTIISIGVLALGGLITPIVINSGIEIIGLLERASILAYHQWFIVMVCKFYKEAKSLNSKHD